MYVSPWPTAAGRLAFGCASLPTLRPWIRGFIVEEGSWNGSATSFRRTGPSKSTIRNSRTALSLSGPRGRSGLASVDLSPAKGMVNFEFNPVTKEEFRLKTAVRTFRTLTMVMLEKIGTALHDQDALGGVAGDLCDRAGRGRAGPSLSRDLSRAMAAGCWRWPAPASSSSPAASCSIQCGRRCRRLRGPYPAATRGAAHHWS